MEITAPNRCRGVILIVFGRRSKCERVRPSVETSVVGKKSENSDRGENEYRPCTEKIWKFSNSPVQSHCLQERVITYQVVEPSAAIIIARASIVESCRPQAVTSHATPHSFCITNTALEEGEVKKAAISNRCVGGAGIPFVDGPGGEEHSSLSCALLWSVTWPWRTMACLFVTSMSTTQRLLVVI